MTRLPTLFLCIGCLVPQSPRLLRPWAGGIDLLALPSPLGYYSSGFGQTTFNAANFPNGNASKFLSRADASGFDGLRQFTFNCKVYLDAANDSADFTFASRWGTSGGSGFFIERNNSDGKIVEVCIASTATEAPYVTRGLGKVPFVAGDEMQAAHDLTVVFDGTQTDPDLLTQNRKRLKIYLDGVPDPNMTFGSGTIPDRLTVSTGAFNLGARGGDVPFFRNQMYNARWWNLAFSDAQVLLAANLAPNGNPLYALASGLPTPAHQWALDEAADGITPVARADAYGGWHLTDNGVPSGGFGEWRDRFGLNPLLSTLNSTGHNGSAPPRLVDGPYGTPVWSFDGDGTVAQGFTGRKLGLVNNPTAWTFWSLLQIHDGHPYCTFCGSEKSGGLDGNNSEPNVWGYFSCDDFSKVGVYTETVCDGTDSAAGYSDENIRTDGKLLVATQSYTPGDDHVRFWINDAEITMHMVFDDPNFPVFKHLFAAGGTMQGWRMGQLGNWDQSANVVNFRGLACEHLMLKTDVSDGLRSAVSRQLMALGRVA